MRNWIRRYRVGLGIAIATGSIVAAVALWPDKPVIPSGARQQVVLYDGRQPQYLQDFAQSALTCPPSATKCWYWDCEEDSGSLVDSTSGDSVALAPTGSPVYDLHSCIPHPDGFTDRGVGTGVSGTYFSSTNLSLREAGKDKDLTIIAWVTRTPSAASLYPSILNSFGSAAAGFYYTEPTNQWVLRMDDGSPQDSVSGVVSPALEGTHLVIVSRRDSDNVVTGSQDGIDLSFTDPAVGSMNTHTSFEFGNRIGGTRPWEGTLHEVMVIDGYYMPLAEQQALYKAFKVPDSVTYTQTTTWKWPLPSEGSFGVRLGTYSPGQWPTAYSTSKTMYGFPSHNAVTNVIGYPNEIDQWTLTGSAVANKYEAPDGSVTADEITNGAGGYFLKTAVGAGSTSAGETWCGRILIKKISGACTLGCLRPHTSAGSATASVTLDGKWQALTGCTDQTVVAKGMTVFGDATACTTAGSADACVLAVADAEYYQDNVPVGACTACTGDANCVCNASYFQKTLPDGAFPATFERMEVLAVGAVSPLIHSAVDVRTLWDLGGWAGVYEGQQPSFVLTNQGGGAEGVAIGKPLQINEEKREYRAVWDVASGIPGTSPKVYSALSIRQDGGTSSWHPSILGARASQQMVAKEQPNAKVLSVGCDASGANCYDGIVEQVRVFTRPAQRTVVADTTHLLSANFTGPAWLQRGYTPDLCSFDFGVADANRWCWSGADYGGGRRDQINGVLLSETGTPVYQVNSGLLSRGQGRRGWHFDRSVGEYVAASAAATLQIGTSGAMTVVISARPATLDSFHRLGSSSTTEAGYSILVNNTGNVYCNLSDGSNRRFCYSVVTSDVAAGKSAVIACQWTKTGSTWNDPTLRINGANVSFSLCSGTAPTGNINNAYPFTVGCAGNCSAGSEMNGEYYEILVNNTALTSAQIDNLYYQTIDQGSYWTEPAGTIGHFLFNEPAVTNGVGLRDHSGNDNHLTVVTNTPDAQYRDMLWPGGSGVVKPAIGYPGNSNYHSVAAAAVGQPSNQQPFSAALWFRINDGSFENRLFDKNIIATDSWLIYTSTAGAVLFRWDTDGSVGSHTAAGSYTDGQWHLAAVKAKWTGAAWQLCTSMDGSAFSCTVTAATGDPSDNTGNLNLGRTPNAGSLKSIAGAAIWKDYELTDADAAQLYGSNGPVANLTYARTATGSKGVCYETAQDPVAGPVMTCFGDGQVPYAYSSEFCGTPGNDRMCLAEPVHAAVTNVALQSEDVTTTWVNNNTTDAGDSALAPDGTLTADTVTASAASGDVRQNFTTIAATSHTYCQYLKRNGTSDVAGFIRIATHSTGTPVASTAFTATSAWQRFCVTGTATVNDTRLETEITTSSESVFWWGASFVASSVTPTPLYCPTDSSTQTCNAPTSNYVAAANLTSWDREAGIIINTTESSAGWSWQLKPAGSTGYLARTRSQADLYNSSDVLQQQLGFTSSTATTPLGSILIFDSDAAFYGTRRAAIRTYAADYAGLTATYSTDTSANWTPAASSDLHLGMSSAGASIMDGYLGNVCIWKDR